MKKSIMLFAIVSLLFSCKYFDKNSDKKVDHFTIVNELRVRENPSDTAKVLYVLYENEGVYFLDEKTEFMDTFTMKGVQYIQPWLKVKTVTGVEGWVFGGGLEEREPASNLTSELKTYEFNSMSGSELKKILGLEIVENIKYDGYYSFYLTSNNVEILHGDFEINGKYEKAEYDVDNYEVTYTGNYYNGSKNGEFLEEIVYWEYDTEIKLVFEYGDCVLGEAQLNSLGEELHYEIKNPKKVSFRFVEDEAEKKGKWVNTY